MAILATATAPAMVYLGCALFGLAVGNMTLSSLNRECEVWQALAIQFRQKRAGGGGFRGKVPHREASERSNAVLEPAIGNLIGSGHPLRVQAVRKRLVAQVSSGRGCLRCRSQ
jgi:hypothetical protein